MAAEDFIITRKRKKFKFARFEEMANCFEAEQFTPAVRDSFVGSAEVVLEVGAGTGLFSLELARRYPKRRFVAIDIKADRLYTGARQALVAGVKNVYFVRARADQLTELFRPGNVDALWLTFADPYPKKRAAKHRMTHPKFLQIYGSLLGQNGLFRFKTDNRPLFDWSLEKLVEAKAGLRFLTFDLHESQAEADYKIMTTYEQRYIAEKKPIYAVEVSLLS